MFVMMFVTDAVRGEIVFNHGTGTFNGIGPTAGGLIDESAIVNYIDVDADFRRNAFKSTEDITEEEMDYGNEDEELDELDQSASKWHGTSYVTRERDEYDQMADDNSVDMILDYEDYGDWDDDYVADGIEEMAKRRVESLKEDEIVWTADEDNMVFNENGELIIDLNEEEDDDSDLEIHTPRYKVRDMHLVKWDAAIDRFYQTLDNERAKRHDSWKKHGRHDRQYRRHARKHVSDLRQDETIDEITLSLLEIDREYSKYFSTNDDADLDSDTDTDEDERYMADSAPIFNWSVLLNDEDDLDFSRIGYGFGGSDDWGKLPDEIFMVPDYIRAMEEAGPQPIPEETNFWDELAKSMEEADRPDPSDPVEVACGSKNAAKIFRVNLIVEAWRNNKAPCPCHKCVALYELATIPFHGITIPKAIEMDAAIGIIHN
jgi:hypothetical protein